MNTKTITADELTSDMLGNRQTVRDNSQRGTENAKIELSKIVIREGFNVRIDYGDIESLAKSILENGQTMPGIVDVLEDGTFLLVEGHRRVKALRLLESQGHTPLYFEAKVNTSKTTEEQRILQMFTTQDNKPLEPVEVAELIRRLVNLGNKPADVARKLGKSAAYISQMLDFASEGQEVKDMVAARQTSVNAVLKVKKAIPKQSERTDAIKKAVAQSGGKSVTADKVTNAKHKRAENLASDLLSEYAIPATMAALTEFIKARI